MASTYELIASQTLGSDTASVTFSSIPQTYDDLIIVCSARSDRSGAGNNGDAIRAWFNGASTDANMSSRTLYSDGSNAASVAQAHFRAGFCTSSTDTASTFGNSECVIPNYAGSANKSGSLTGISENNGTVSLITASASLWSSTNAITSVELLPIYGSNFQTGSSFYLYGVTHA